jgi:hypothetical protein
VPGLAWLHPYFNASLVLEFGLACTAVVLQQLALKRAKQEVAAGYTTAPGSHRELPQVDHVSRVVIRAAGKASLRHAELKEARARARNQT